MRYIRPEALAVVLASVAAVSCTHSQVVRTQSPPAPPPMSVWERQVRNAVDAGEGDYQLRVLRERVANEPDSVAARVELAKAYRERSYPEIALEISRLAAARFPESGEAQLSLVRDLRQVNRRGEAIAGLETFLKAHPQTAPEHFSWLGILRDESGLWQAGEPAHRKAIELSPGADALHNNLGYNLLMQKKPDEAAAEFREALRLNPASQVARNNLATALAHSNAPGQAVAAWQQTTDAASAHNNLAAVWIENGNYPEARKELGLALGYNRTHPAALRNLELVERLDGQPSTLQAAHADRSWWARRMGGLKRLFVGPLDVDPVKAGRQETAASASAH